VKKSISFLLAIGLASCSAPKATIVEEAPINSGPNLALTQPGVAPVSLKEAKPTLPIARITGLRRPDMLVLPQDEQLRSAPSTAKEGKATVIARPPEE
jgi:hypothetical protein